MKKKIIVVLMAAVMAASAAACGKDQKEGGADTQTNNQESETDSDTGTDSDTKSDSETEAKADKVEYDVNNCVTLGDYSALHLSLPNTYKVTKKQIDDYANNMAEYYAQPTYKDTDKETVEEGDTVNIDYEGKKDGVAFKGGTAAGHNLTIGSHSFIDGFEEGLIGKKVGETVDLDLTFPENYQSEDLAGADVVFTVKINKIVEVDESVEFELTDEFVKANFNFDTVSDYKKNVKEYLKTTNESNKNMDTRQAALDKLQEICEVTLPEELLTARVSDYIVQYKNEHCSGTTLEDYLKENFNGMTEADFETDITKEMETNLQHELILEAIAAKEGMELDEEAFKSFVQEQMSSYGYGTEEEFYAANGVNAEAGEKYSRKIFVCNRALDKVIEDAAVEYGVTPENEEKEEE